MNPETDARHHALLVRGQEALNAGRFDEVRALCDEIFALAPGSVNGFWLYLMSGQIAPGDAVFARIRAAARQDLPAPLASQLHFMLGKGFDDLNDTAAAFAAFREANRLKPAQYDPAATRQTAENICAALEAAPPLRLPPAPPRMVFVLGMPRSGTSLATQILGAHPQITNLGEQTALGAAIGPNPAAFLRAATPETLDTARRAYLARVSAAAPVLVDKMPDNIWYAGLIPMLFPDAAILHMTRPRLASCWSCYRNDFREGHGYSYDFRHLLTHHATLSLLARATQKRYPENWHEIALERLAADPRATLAPVFTALSLDWDDACHAPEQGGAVATLSKWQVRQGIDPTLPQGWKRYLPYIERTWG